MAAFYQSSETESLEVKVIFHHFFFSLKFSVEHNYNSPHRETVCKSDFDAAVGALDALILENEEWIVTAA